MPYMNPSHNKKPEESQTMIKDSKNRANNEVKGESIGTKKPAKLLSNNRDHMTMDLEHKHS